MTLSDDLRSVRSLRTFFLTSPNTLSLRLTSAFSRLTFPLAFTDLISQFSLKSVLNISGYLLESNLKNPRILCKLVFVTLYAGVSLKVSFLGPSIWYSYLV